MRILLHSATRGEIQPILDFFSSSDKPFHDDLPEWHGHHIDILISGVGIPHTVFSLTKRMAERNYDFCISAGICGSFDKNIAIGSVLEVSEDRFGDLGYEENDGRFVDFFESGLAEGAFPYTTNGWLKPPHTFSTDLPKVTGVTVNKVSGTESSATVLCQKYSADIESMEGAAFFLVCMLKKMPCVQIKAVSNYVEARDKSKWDIPLAVRNLNTSVLDFIKTIP